MSVSECSNSKQDEGPPKWRSTRFSLAYMIFTGLIVMFYQRSSFSMVIVCMVNHTALDTQRRTAHLAEMNSSVDNDGANISAVGIFPYAVSNKTMTSVAGTDGRCHREDSTTSRDEDGPFLWDKDLQGLLLGALYWGYTVVQIPGSYIIQRHGARMVVGVAMVCMSALHILCHPGALLSPWAVFALRVAVGLCTGVAIPAMYSVWGRWAPVTERAQLLAVSFAGQMIANASAFPVSALLCRHGFWDGWPSVFYVFGAIGLLWSTLWFFVMSNSPESHSRISPAERAYIVSTRADAAAQKQKLKVPWRSIVTAPCFWAIAVSQFTYNWAFFFMLSNLPIFLKEAMDLDIKSNGVFSMLPYLFLFVMMMSAGFVSDAVISRRLLTVVASRKLFTAIAYLVSAVSLVLMSHQQCSEVAAVVSLLVLAVGIMGLANTGGFYVNPYDIAPRFATSICTATNTMATVTGIINPYIVAIITKDKTRSQWQDVYYITAGIFAFGTLFFCIFGQGEVQEWARLPDEEFETKSELTTFKCDDKEHGDHHQKKIYIVSSQRL